MDFLKDLNLDKVRNLAEDAFNQAKPKTDLEAKVYEVLSHKNWGASSTIMNDIARDTYDHDKFLVISQLMWENMENQRPAAWRVVFKGLTLLEHLIKNGSERCVDDARNHGHALRALHQFNYYEGTIDRGLGVREKSKQLVEILGDDERIREERQKAKSLREKFGGAKTNSSSAGKYSGYGNDNWNSGGSGGGGGGGNSGGSGGYGDGGIDSKGYSGRYDDDNTRAPSRAVEPTPTFAALPDELPKKSKKKKKDLPVPAAAPEPSIDLFSFDAPAPASSAVDDEFDSFQTAGGFENNDPFSTPAAPNQSAQSSFQTANAFGGSDPFAAPAASSQSAQSSFQTTGGFGSSDPFSAPSAQNQAAQSFDAFGGSTQQQQAQSTFGNANDPFSSNNNTSNGFGMQQQSTIGQQQSSMIQPKSNFDNDDDFGDFAAARASSSSMGGGPVDPLFKLISLDGLSKNSNKDNKEAKLNQPIIANLAAATFIQEKEQIQASMKKSTAGSSMSFAGIDGLPKQQNGGGFNSMLPPPVPMGGGFNPNVMGTGGSMDVISALDPSLLIPQKVPQQQPSGMMNQTFGGFSGTQQQQMGMPSQGGNMTGMQGGMNNMQGGMGGMQSGMGGMQSGMGGMQGGMGGMQSGMGGMQGGMGGMQGGMNGMQGGMNSMQGGMNGIQGDMSGMNINGGMNMQGGNPGMGMQGNMGGQGGAMGGQNMGGFR